MEYQDSVATPPPARGFVDNSVGASRLAVGLAQGIFLYLILEAWQTQSWPATRPLLFTPLFLLAVFVPALLISSLGHLNRRQLDLWCGGAAITVVLLGIYGVWRMSGPLTPSAASQAPIPWAPLTAVLVPWFFIAHALVMAGVRDRRRLASYHSYFEIAWKLLVQMAFSALFVGVLWLVLMLGAQLFLLVRLNFLAELLPKRWFAFPVTAMAWSCAMHVTDVRPGIVSSIRNLLLGLLSWILPVMTLLVGGFVLTLPFTGLAPLWATKLAASLLLVVCGFFVVLINAAWQEGPETLARAPVIVRLSMRIAALLLVPVAAIAAYALALRVTEYGWTSERVVAAACVLVAACYALGYAGAALRNRLAPAIATVNIATALVVLATCLALLSPLADPVRLAVNSQVARLQSGKVAVEKFDFVWLNVSAGRWGKEALARLDAGAGGPQAALLRERIAQARATPGPAGRADGPLAPPDLASNVHVWPEGAHLPASFLHQQWGTAATLSLLPDCLRRSGKTCEATLVDLTGDGKPEVLLVGSAVFDRSAVLQEDEQGNWRPIGMLPVELAGCESVRDAIKSGAVQAAPPLANDLDINGTRVRLEGPANGAFACPKLKAATPPSR
jgi:hypothetical protein